jgi:hypothetical protein
MPKIEITANKINSFEHVLPGWHYGDGIPANPQTVRFAQDINQAFQDLGILNTNAFLGVGGQIQVNGYLEDRRIELIIEDEFVFFYAEKAGQPLVEESNLNIVNAISRIRFWGSLWVTLDSFTQKTLTMKMEDFKASPYKMLAMVAFPLLTRNVSPQQGKASVSISRNITLPTLENRQYSSSSQPNTYQLITSS